MERNTYTGQKDMPSRPRKVLACANFTKLCYSHVILCGQNEWQLVPNVFFVTSWSWEHEQQEMEFTKYYDHTNRSVFLSYQKRVCNESFYKKLLMKRLRKPSLTTAGSPLTWLRWLQINMILSLFMVSLTLFMLFPRCSFSNTTLPYDCIGTTTG